MKVKFSRQNRSLRKGFSRYKTKEPGHCPVSYIKENGNEKKNKKGASRIRKLYIAKLIGRCIILGISAFLCWKRAAQFQVLDDFFGEFSLLHILWGLWIVDMLYPERFWEFSNEALKCVNCTDKLCTQYCQKLRKSKNKKKV